MNITLPRETVQQALDALGKARRQIQHVTTVAPHGCIGDAITALRTALAATAAQKVEPCKLLCELCVKRGYNFCANAAETTPLQLTSPAAREPQYRKGCSECDMHRKARAADAQWRQDLAKGREILAKQAQQPTRETQ